MTLQDFASIRQRPSGRRGLSSMHIVALKRPWFFRHGDHDCVGAIVRADAARIWDDGFIAAIAGAKLEALPEDSGVAFNPILAQ